MDDYTLLISRQASKELERLSVELVERIDERILGLAKQPRPPGVKKLRGEFDRWRIRVGDYRILYEIDDRSRIVRILAIPHRSKAYD